MFLRMKPSIALKYSEVVDRLAGSALCKYPLVLSRKFVSWKALALFILPASDAMSAVRVGNPSLGWAFYCQTVQIKEMDMNDDRTEAGQ